MPPLAGQVVDALAFDQLHHQIRQAFVGRTAIKQPRNVRMVEVSEDLPLGPEALLVFIP
jgi:hypothetical protein